MLFEDEEIKNEDEVVEEENEEEVDEEKLEELESGIVPGVSFCSCSYNSRFNPMDPGI